MLKDGFIKFYHMHKLKKTAYKIVQRPSTTTATNKIDMDNFKKSKTN